MYGQRIRQLRKERKMTLRELAEELNIPFTTLGNYEREDRQPNFDTFETIASYFNVTIDYLAGRSEDKTIEENLFREDFVNLQDILQDIEDPETRKTVVSIFDQMFLITNSELKLGNENKRELELIKQIVHFIFRLKQGLGFGNQNKELFKAKSEYDFALKYMSEKNILDNYFNELFQIYSKREFKEM
ncbi:helix-turn-helix domain-containing protein [Thalassorhabdus alkalitolerans]|uniref:Helix-turn-helix domain-containing protein n=1 Tax=Thalassorhabdus alkalitolerans TaxID=2282697 RepID=A0ABW0YN04_9BACI